MSYTVFLRSIVTTLIAIVSIGCSGSGTSSGTIDGRFDVAALSEDVFRLCETAECSDYSEDECKLYLRYDILEYAYLSESPDACFTAFRAEMSCLADAASCDEESCYAPDGSCTFNDEVPDIEVPEAVQPAQVACEFRANCEAEAFGDAIDRDRSIIDCQVEYIVRTELFQHDRGSDCAEAFIDFLVCIGESEDVPCSPSGEEEEAACPGEVTRFEARCFG